MRVNDDNRDLRPEALEERIKDVETKVDKCWSVLMQVEQVLKKYLKKTGNLNEE